MKSRNYLFGMKINEGTVDRTLRIAAGLGILSLTIVGPKTLWGLVGIVPLLTGTVGFCPLYTALGINTGARTEKGPAQGV